MVQWNYTQLIDLSEFADYHIPSRTSHETAVNNPYDELIETLSVSFHGIFLTFAGCRAEEEGENNQGGRLLDQFRGSVGWVRHPLFRFFRLSEQSVSSRLFSQLEFLCFFEEEDL